MSYDADTPIRLAPDEPQDMSADQWVALLHAAGSFNSPLWNGVPDPEAATRAMWQMVTTRRHRASFWLSIPGREHTFGMAADSVLRRNDTRSWTNARTCRTPGMHYTIVRDAVRKSDYVRYDDVLDSLLDGLNRVDDPNYAYAGKLSVSDVIHTWTESEGDAYTAYCVAKMNEWSAAVPSQRPPHIALSAGHRNGSGGNDHEKAQTAVLTPAIANACRLLGMHVRVVQGNDGEDMYSGSLHDVALTVAGWDVTGWPVDIYLETHTEGAGGARGMFAIYPDWGDDVDTDVRDKLGPDIVARVTAATGLGKRGSGLMSEKQTGVGAGGDRLGIFAYTTSIKDHATRLIVEFGAHDNAADLAIVDAPDFAGKAGAAVAQAFAAFLGWQSGTSGGDSTNPLPDVTPSTNDDALYLPENPFGHIPIRLGFKGYLEGLAQARYPQDTNAAILSIIGYPLAAEYPTASGSAQVFERGVLLFDAHAAPPFDITLKRTDDAIPEAA